MPSGLMRSVLFCVPGLVPVVCATMPIAVHAQETATASEAPLATPAGIDSAQTAGSSDGLTATAPVAAETPAAELATVAVDPQIETAQPEARQSAPASRLIEEIVVTAQKRDENLKDVPISISAFSAEKLEALGVKDPSDVQLITPGLTYNSQVAYSIIYLRGVGTDAFIPSADQSVASYVDGFYTPFGFNLASKFNNIERVEVLKGPQGTLFGRNSTGGAINIVTRKPSDQFELSLDGKLGNFNSQSGSAYVSAPVIEDLSVSAALLYDHSNNYHKLRNESVEEPDENTKAGDFKLRWHLTEALTADVGFTYMKYDGLGSLAGPGRNQKPLGVLANGGEPDAPYEYSGNERMYNKATNKMYTGVLAYDSDAFDAKLLGSYQDANADALWDYDGGPGNFAVFQPSGQFMEVTNAELQLLSTPGGAFTFKDSVVWTLGYNYFESSGGFDPVFFALLNPDAPSQGDPYSLVGSTLGLALEALTDAGLPIPDKVELQLNGIVDTKAHAVFAQTTWRPIDWFGVTIGGRYQVEDRGVAKSTSGVSRGPDNDPIPLLNFGTDRTTTKNFGPKLTLDFRPFADDTLVYGTLQRGFKSGTYNVVAIYTKPNYVKPEKVTAAEIGIKGFAFDRALNYNAAVFQSKVENLQTLVVSLASGGAVQLANAAQVTIRGVDFDATLQPFPEKLPGLVISASAAYLDGTYDSFPNAPGFDETTGVYFGPGELVPSPPRDFSGNRAVRTPKRSGTLGFNYTFAVPAGSVEAGANTSYNSGYFFDTQNTAKQPAFATLNAQLSYLHEVSNVRLSLWGTNITKEVYLSSVLVTDFNDHTVYAPPRMYGLTLAWTYK